MAFQRSYSKVWWGSDRENSYYGESGPHSLDTYLKATGNLSRIVESEELSKSWSSHDSPGSLKSQDSGFSDNDDLPNGLNANTSPSKSEESQNSISTTETPPTVIRRKTTTTRTSNCDPRRISFSGPSSPISLIRNYEFVRKIDEMSLSSGGSKSDLNERTTEANINSPCTRSGSKGNVIRRRHVNGVSPRTRRNIMPQSSTSNDPDSYFKDYNNETIYIGGTDDDFVDLSGNFETPPKRIESIKFVAPCTSTPKNEGILHPAHDNPSGVVMRGVTLPYHFDYPHPSLNGNSLSVQYWLDDIRSSYCHEVMSTLQTKSVLKEAFRSLKITTTLVAKTVRQLQTSSLILQGEFERVEKTLRGETNDNLREAIVSSQDLIESVQNFVKTLERRSIFFSDSKSDRRRFDENMEHTQLIFKDLKISLSKNHYLDPQSLLDDIQVLKRYILITLRLIFEKLIRVIVKNIEDFKCDLMLRANLNMVSTLSNVDYNGFASLNDAFNKNETVRVLLLVCIDHKQSSVRALTLRALVTICSSPESIRQFGEAGGIEIIKDILLCNPKNTVNRTEPEKREAVSLLTQITAPWHGTDNYVSGLKDFTESIVEGLTDIIVKTNCCQTLLLCAASLNNLSRLEVTSVYSIMSNETIIKLKEIVENRGPATSIFLYEQVVSTLNNMSLNRKCQNHLANKDIIDFLSFIFHSQFHKKYKSRSENEALRRTIKTTLHIFQRLIYGSVIGTEILENNFVTIFSRIENNLSNDSEYFSDISFLNRQLNESIAQRSFNRSSGNRSSGGSTFDSILNITKQESYV